MMHPLVAHQVARQMTNDYHRQADNRRLVNRRKNEQRVASESGHNHRAVPAAPQAPRPAASPAS